MNFPAELKYTQDHEWVKVEGDSAYVGITDFAQRELGDIVYVEVETIGHDLSKGDIFGTVEAVKTVSDLFMPVSGKVLELNKDIESTPELVNQDPYQKGWMIKVALKDLSEVSNLMDAQAYRDFTGSH